MKGNRCIWRPEEVPVAEIGERGQVWGGRIHDRNFISRGCGRVLSWKIMCFSLDFEKIALAAA